MADAVMTAFTPELLAECDVPDAEARDIAYRLGEHVCAALRIHERLRRVAAQATAGQALLQHLPCPVWLLDGDRFVHHANPAARAEQAAEAHAMLRDARLALCNEETDVQLTLRLRTLTDARHGSKAAIELHRSRGDTPAWLHLQTLQPEAVLGAFGTRPLVLATLFDPARSATPDPLALCGLCALTAAEARVAALLAEGLTAKEAARRLGNSPATVRSHQRQIFAKLGVPRTVDVVRVLRHGEALWARAGSGVSGHPCG